jgi:hypothetical protein
MTTPQQRTARAEGGTHDGEEFDISEDTVGLLLNSRRDPPTLEYYELVLYMRGNLLRFVREYDAEERRLAFGGSERFVDGESAAESYKKARLL